MKLKTFLHHFALILIFFALMDSGVGLMMEYLYSIAGDKYKREEFIRHEMESEIVLMGSSKCTHHYVPSILKDSLNMTVYNCGQRGNGIIYEYGRLQTIYQRYTPKLVIIDFIQGYDVEANDNNRYLDFLKLDYGTNDSIDNLFNMIDKHSIWKMEIQSYKYNSTICDIFLNIILRGRDRFNSDGYFPLYESNTTGTKNNAFIYSKDPIKIDSLKIDCIKKIARNKKDGCKILFVLSPSFNSINTNFVSIISDIAKQYNVPFLNYSNCPNISNNEELFYDGTHLNDKGAKLFTRRLASDLIKMKELIEDK